MDLFSGIEAIYCCYTYSRGVALAYQKQINHYISNKSFPANHSAKVEAESYDSVMTVPNFEVLQQRGLRMTPLQRVSLLEVGPNILECVLQASYPLIVHLRAK